MGSSNNEWFQSWFGPDYLDVYPHRDQAEADAQIAFICEQIPLTNTSRVLDIACGAGRHLRALAERGINAVGIDYSKALLDEAQNQLKDFPTISLTRADMRELPFANNEFDAALSLFTSFGYFATDEEHIRLLREWRRVLRPEGYFVLDYANKDFVLAHLRPHSTELRGTLHIEQQRELSPLCDRMIKEINITDEETGTRKRFRESVRLYSESEIRSMLNETGFHITKCFGNLQGRKYSPDADRLVIIASAH